MKAIVRFHIGSKIYEIGDEVPQEVYQKYPQLVGVVFQDNEKKEMKDKTEKVEKGFIPKRHK